MFIAKFWEGFFVGIIRALLTIITLLTRFEYSRKIDWQKKMRQMLLSFMSSIDKFQTIDIHKIVFLNFSKN
jgi:hypothetical protein